MSWPVSQRQQFRICVVKNARCLAWEKWLSSSTATPPRVHTSCSTTTSIIYLSSRLEWKISSSLFLLIDKLLFLLLASNLGYKCRICYLEVRREINIYKWFSCSCTHAICICLSVDKCTHISYIYRMSVCSVAHFQYTYILWCSLYEKCVFLIFKTLWNLWKPKSTCLTSESDTRCLPWTFFIWKCVHSACL